MFHHEMFLVMRKPVLGGLRLEPIGSPTEMSENIEILSKASLDVILSFKQITMVLISLRGCAVWSVPLLFICSKVNFSREESHNIIWFF